MVTCCYGSLVLQVMSCQIMSRSVTVKSLALLLDSFPFSTKSKSKAKIFACYLLLVLLLLCSRTPTPHSLLPSSRGDDNIDSRIEPFNSVFVVIK